MPRDSNGGAVAEKIAIRVGAEDSEIPARGRDHTPDHSPVCQWLVSLSKDRYPALLAAEDAPATGAAGNMHNPSRAESAGSSTRLRRRSLALGSRLGGTPSIASRVTQHAQPAPANSKAEAATNLGPAGRRAGGLALRNSRL